MLYFPEWVIVTINAEPEECIIFFLNRKKSCGISLNFSLLLQKASAGLFFVTTAICAREHQQQGELIIKQEESCIEFPATFHPKRFNRAIGLKNHHFIAWEKGTAAGKALFTTPVPDSVIHDALVEIGATPGNNLTNETWSQRDNAKSPFPDLLVGGSAVKVEFLKGPSVYLPQDFLADRSDRPFDFRFGGNRALIPIWKSGCVACLQSCPGAKIGNHAYSIRDLVKSQSVFSIKKQTDFREGDPFSIRISVQSSGME